MHHKFLMTNVALAALLLTAAGAKAAHGSLSQEAIRERRPATFSVWANNVLS
jgi:hypothetical protein